MHLLPKKTCDEKKVYKTGKTGHRYSFGLYAIMDVRIISKSQRFVVLR